MIFTDFREICSDESANIYGLRLLSWKIFVFTFQSNQAQTPCVSDKHNIDTCIFPHKKQVKHKGHILSA